MRRSLYLFICIYVYLVIGAAICFYQRSIGNIYFVWNAFLAFLPYFFSRILNLYVTKGRRNPAVIGVIALCWLVFFPNAPYMITDLIHVGSNQFYNAGSYSHDIFEWVLLVYIGMGVVFSTLVGLRSLYDIHTLSADLVGKRTGAAVVAAVALLSGFGIYLGRILRFNSWDILHPISLLVRIREELSSFSILYSLLFSGYIAATYVIFYLVVSDRTNARAHTGAPRF